MSADAITAIVVLLVFLIILSVIVSYSSKIKKKVDDAKDTIADAIERQRETGTIEYQQKLIELMEAGHSEEQAKAILKAKKKVEQLKKKE